MISVFDSSQSEVESGTNLALRLMISVHSLSSLFDKAEDHQQIVANETLLQQTWDGNTSTVW